MRGGSLKVLWVGVSRNRCRRKRHKGISGEQDEKRRGIWKRLSVMESRFMCEWAEKLDAGRC